MKTIKSIFLFVAFGIVSLNGQKKALLIGISQYGPNTEWASLSSDNDIKYVSRALESVGFDSKQIQIIQNENATKEGILSALNSFGEELNSGEFAFIHFSGHGQQVIDDNNDEIDFLDEAIVPYDSPKKYKKGIYEGELLIRDDQLQLITQKIRKKIGPKGQLVLLMDSCHSGTGTRGMGKARGTHEIMGPSTKILSSTKSEYGFNSKEEKDLAPMACYFGSSAQELNYETFDHEYNMIGSLSYTFSQVLSNLSSKCSFKELFDRIRNKMIKISPNQNPMWEGPADVVIFENSSVNLESKVDVLQKISAKEWVLNTGSLNSVFAGSSFDIYETDSGKKVSNGVVLNSNLSKCLVQLDKPQEQNDALYHAVLRNTTNPPCQVRLSDQIQKSSEWKTILANINQNEICSFGEENAELYLTECGTNENSLQLLTKEGDLIYEGKNPSKVGKHSHFINKFLKSYAVGKYLREYESLNSSYNFSIEIIPLAVEKKGRKIISQKALPIKSKIGKDGFLHFLNGDYLEIKITNVGKESAYFSILDIQSDNQINFIAPNRINNHTAEDFYLAPGKSYTTDFPIRVAPPFGNELIKLVTSDKPLDLEGALAGSTTRGQSEMHPFEEILNSISVKSRSQEKKIGIGQLGTFDKFFKIVD